MRFKALFSAVMLPALAGALALTSCNDEMSGIGETVFDQNVKVYVDSSVMRLDSRIIDAGVIDARSNYNLLGSISVPEYGSLSASYVSRLLSASKLTIPDSITPERIDSMRLTLQVPRANIVGDSLAPQQIKVWKLIRQLPADITSAYNPDGNYDAANPLGVTNFTLSGLALSDSAFRKLKAIPVNIRLPREFAVETVRAYRENPSIFQWPDRLAEKFPGIYVGPTFGQGCIAAVATANFFTYWHHTVERTVVENDVSVKKKVQVKDSVSLFSTAPEVLASNNLTYEPAASLKARIDAGEKIITTPLGWQVAFKFPARAILDAYNSTQNELSVINNLAMTIPAAEVKNDYGIGIAPDLLMIRTSEIEDFFANSKVPDSKSSFASSYSSVTKTYRFSGLRQYLLELLDKDGKVSEEEFDRLCDFTLIPVSFTKEETQQNGETVSYITGCNPYLQRPTMTVLDMEKAMIIFTYTHQYVQ